MGAHSRCVWLMSLLGFVYYYPRSSTSIIRVIINQLCHSNPEWFNWQRRIAIVSEF